MSNYQKIKIIVAGDSGVGKTAFVNLLCFNKILAKPNWTIGAQIEVKLHDYLAGTPSESGYMVELWDIGGYKNHQNSRPVFYPGTDGIILCYDITNKKSQLNLKHWLDEILSANSQLRTELESDTTSTSSTFSMEHMSNLSYFNYNQPFLIVGTHLDQVAPCGLGDGIVDQPTGAFSHDNKIDEILMSNLVGDSLAPGSNNLVMIYRFFDQVISGKIDRKGKDTSLYVNQYSNKRHVSIRIDKSD